METRRAGRGQQQCWDPAGPTLNPVAFAHLAFITVWVPRDWLVQPSSHSLNGCLHGPHGLQSPELARLVSCTFSQQRFYKSGISTLLGSPLHFFFTSLLHLHTLPFRVSLSISPSQILFHVSRILYPCTTRVTWPTPVSASSLTSTQAPWDKSGLWGPGWLNMRKHFCRQSCVSEAPQSLVSKLTLTNDLNFVMGGIWPMPEASSGHHSYCQNAKCSVCFNAHHLFKSRTSLGPSFIFHLGPEASIWVLSVLYAPSLPEHLTEIRWQNQSHNLHSELTEHLFLQIPSPFNSAY